MPPTLVDAHVHFYPRFDAWAGIQAAATNFSTARRRLSLPSAGFGVLMFVRSTYEGPLHELHARLSRDVPDGWTLDPEVGGGMGWLRVTGPSDGSTIYVLDGQQVKTANGLEVLALAPATEFEEGQPFAATLEGVLQSGAVTVIPWGFGKWLGHRGRQVEGALAVASRGTLFFGDNSSRPGPLPEPKLFHAARARGVFVLPGSDPMPLPEQERSIGRFGFVLDGFDPGAPVESIRRSLGDLRQQPVVFGNRDNLLRSVYMQIRLRLGRRRIHGAAMRARA